MDLVYIPEVLAYGSLRAPFYRDYEQPWNKNYFSCGKFTSHGTSPPQHEIQNPPAQNVRSSQRDHCQLCKEKKRRALGLYIRKNRSNSGNDIHEEEEENAAQEVDNNQEKESTSKE